jgi:hypothetical protein
MEGGPSDWERDATRVLALEYGLGGTIVVRGPEGLLVYHSDWRLSYNESLSRLPLGEEGPDEFLCDFP